MKKCILVFDDDQEILEVCRIILEQQNYLVVSRLVCEDIIEDIREVQPDIVLLDLWIPFIGGEKAVKIIKGNESTRHIPVILFSANAEIERVFERTNADGFLEKPFEIPTLLAIINKNI